MLKKPAAKRSLAKKPVAKRPAKKRPAVNYGGKKKILSNSDEYTSVSKGHRPKARRGDDCDL